MKKVLVIITILIIIGLVAVVLAIYLSFNPRVEKVSFTINEEIIYLKQLTGYGIDESVISKKAYTANKPDTSEEYVD